MAVTETLRALGSWGLTLKPTLSDEVWKKIDYYGHIAIHVGKRPGLLDDSLLRSARYVGPITDISESTSKARSIGGAGMALWLGDPEGKGDIFVDPIVVDGDFNDVITALLPASGSVIAGNIVNTGDSFGPSTFQFQTPRDVIDYVCQTLGTAWRVNGDATLDAGDEDDLFVVDPRCVVVRKDLSKSVAGFDDMFLSGLAGNAETQRDVEDYTTDVLLLAQGINGSFVQAEASTPTIDIPYVDLHGNKVKFARIIQESETDATNAPARAQLQLNRFSGTRDAITLNTSNYDIKGTAQVGDYLWVYDPGMALFDLANEQVFRGQRINPYKLRLTETTWPVTRRMSVFYRAGDGKWYDLTGYVEPEQGTTTLVVGGYNRSLSEGGGSPFPVTPPEADTSVPDVTVWVEPFTLGVYQSPSTGMARGDVLLSWIEPENVGGGTILDGSHYDIRFRRATVPAYPITWDMLEAAALTWDDLEASGATWDYPITYPETDWQNATAPFDTTTFRLQELVPAMPYEVQIRAVDLANPSNRGAWSALALFETTNDDIPPATPAPPFIASNPLYVQMTHTLGVSTGGTFNLDRDMHHLELHGGPEPLFSCTDDTLLGKAAANYGSIIGQIPVVQTFSIASLDPVYFKVIAVDEAGNKSNPSTGVGVVVGLIDDQYISTLTASKITAGTIDASVLVGGRIATMPESDFPGVEMTSQGLEGWNTVGFRSLFWDSSTGRLHVNGNGGIEIKDGTLQVKNAAGITIVEIGECTDGRHGVQVFSDTGSRVARMGEIEAGGGDHGIEVISDFGELVKVDTLAFGMEASTVSALEGSTSSTFNNLVTVGPFVTVQVGNSCRMVVIVSAFMNGFASNGGVVGFDIAGPAAYFSGANQLRAFSLGGGVGGSGPTAAASKAFVVDGLPQAGSYTVQLKYRSATNTVLCQFADRHLIVMPY